MNPDWPALWQEWMEGWAQRKNPVMPFWPKDWLSDQHVASMSYHEQGVYLILLLHNWLDGSLPEYIPSISALLGVKTFHFKRHTWDGKLSIHFVVVSDGRISNKRLILEGVRLVRERRRRRPDNGRTDTSALARARVPSPSPSPSPSEDPLSPKGGSVAPLKEKPKSGGGTTYRAHEGRKDEARSRVRDAETRRVLVDLEKNLAKAAKPEEVANMVQARRRKK